MKLSLLIEFEVLSVIWYVLGYFAKGLYLVFFSASKMIGGKVDI